MQPKERIKQCHSKWGDLGLVLCSCFLFWSWASSFSFSVSLSLVWFFISNWRHRTKEAFLFLLEMHYFNYYKRQWRAQTVKQGDCVKHNRGEKTQSHSEAPDLRLDCLNISISLLWTWEARTPTTSAPYWVRDPNPAANSNLGLTFTNVFSSVNFWYWKRL